MEQLPPPAPPKPARHYGLDWLRIAAFCLLIPYHAALVFAPGEWIIDARESVSALIAPMALLTPWRLALLFAVSGYASAKLFARTGDTGVFLISRSKRLLIPLAFAYVALLPVEVWIREVVRGYPHDLLTFWLRDYWHIGTSWGVEQPSPEHLWFVEYLWGYTMILGALAATGLLPWLARTFAKLCSGMGLLWVPIATLIGAKLALLFVLPEHGNLFTDWNAHSINLQFFLLGFLIAGSDRAWRDIAKVWPWALAVVAIAAPTILYTEFAWMDATPPHGWQALDRAARMAMAWGMILLLFGAAERWLNRDGRWRATLAEAVFPAYIVHQVAIVVVAWWLQPVGGDRWLGEYAVVLGITLAVCTLFYFVGRSLSPLRPLIGLAPRKVAKVVRGDKKAVLT